MHLVHLHSLGAVEVGCHTEVCKRNVIICQISGRGGGVAKSVVWGGVSGVGPWELHQAQLMQPTEAHLQVAGQNNTSCACAVSAVLHRLSCSWSLLGYYQASMQAPWQCAAQYMTHRSRRLSAVSHQLKLLHTRYISEVRCSKQASVPLFALNFRLYAVWISWLEDGQLFSCQMVQRTGRQHGHKSGQTARATNERCVDEHRPTRGWRNQRSTWLDKQSLPQIRAKACPCFLSASIIVSHMTILT